VVIWDEGTYEVPEGTDPGRALSSGRLGFELRGKKLKGGFALMRLARSRKGNEWLLVKKADEHARPGWTLETELTPARLRKLEEKIPPCEAS
jgi:bifunctional non-homologous end joining protein LigD